MAALDERSYRRGLILGLTMAEVMILVLFSLLLIWMFGFRDREREAKGAIAQKSQMEKLIAENEELKFKAAELTELRKILTGKPGAPNQINDVFRELTLAKQQVAQLQSQLKSAEIIGQTMSSLGYPLRDEKTAAESARELKDKLNIASAVQKYAKEHPAKSNLLSESDTAAILGSLAQIEPNCRQEGRIQNLPQPNALTPSASKQNLLPALTM